MSRKLRKPVKIAAGITAVCITAVILTFSTIVPNAEYNRATELMDSDKYTEAAVLFEKLGSFKDSKELAEQCRQGTIYITAVNDMNSGEYEKYRRAPEYVIEKSVSDGIFTGQFQGGRPEGKGTIFYFDHRYTGMFHNGVPGGEGVIYMRDGSEIKGRFSTVPAQDAEELKFTNITYYRR